MTRGGGVADPFGGLGAAVVVLLDGGVPVAQFPAPLPVDGLHVGQQVQQLISLLRMTARGYPCADLVLAGDLFPILDLADLGAAGFFSPPGACCQLVPVSLAAFLMRNMRSARPPGLVSLCRWGALFSFVGQAALIWRCGRSRRSRGPATPVLGERRSVISSLARAHRPG